MRRLDQLLSALLLVSLVGCGDQTGPPLPDPVPRPTLLRATSVGEQVDIVGLPGAVPGPGPVQVQVSGEIFSTEATSAGSFVLSINAGGAETLTIRYADANPVSLDLEPPPSQEPTLSFSFTNPEGTVITLDIEVDPTLPPRDVIVANLRTGEVVVGTEVNGIARVSIEALPGDELRIYVDGAPLTSPTIFTVPGPNT